jgi:hypothetical protein
MEGIVAMSAKQRKVYQLALEGLVKQNYTDNSKVDFFIRSLHDCTFFTKT